MGKAVLFIMDGLGDEGERTPLLMAYKPKMDFLAGSGLTGYYSALGSGQAPGSGIAHLLLFGYSEKDYPGRGVFEALGVGLDLKPGQVAFRANLATVDEKGRVVDRRAGRPSDEIAEEVVKEIAKFEYKDFEFSTFHTTEHRLVVVINKGSADITETDPHKVGVKAPVCRPLCKAAGPTAEAVNAYVRFVHERLEELAINRERVKKGLPKINMVLLRGPGKLKRVPSFKRKYGLKAACVAGGALYKGVARYVGMDVLQIPGATGGKNTNLIAKAEGVRDALKKHDFVFLHVKATDSYAHDRDPVGKARMIQRVDQEVLPTLIDLECFLAITGDHSTSSIRGEHSALPSPLLISGPSVGADPGSRFDEVHVAKGRLGTMRRGELIHLLLDLADLAKVVFP